jgi:ferredoxin
MDLSVKIGGRFMIINKDLCNGCGECITECPYKAIIKDNAGEYIIDAKLCNNCQDLGDIECIRVCASNAIIFNDGAFPEFDKMWRVRPEHLIWIMALIGSRGSHDNWKYIIGHPQWDCKRKMAADAILDPELKIRFVRSYDDICIKCGAKQEPGHPEVSGKVDDLCYAKLGVNPGTVLRFWDAVKMIEEKFSLAFIRTLTPIPDDIFSDFLKFVSPDAKVLTNE